jgi:hypothetical protein
MRFSRFLFIKDFLFCNYNFAKKINLVFFSLFFYLNIKNNHFIYYFKYYFDVITTFNSYRISL